MNVTRRTVVRGERRRWTTGLAVVAHAVAVLPLVAGPVSPAAAATPTVTPAPAVCGVQLLTRDNSGPRSDLLVSAPQQLAGVDLLPPAFSVRQADQAVPVTVRRPAASEQAVAVVLVSSSRTSAAAYQVGQAAATGFLADLPSQVRTAVGATGSPSSLVPLTDDRVRATRALQLARRGPGAGVEATVDRLAGDLPVGAHVVLFADDAPRRLGRPSRALASRLHERGIAVSHIGYAGPPSPEAASAWSTSPSQRACAAASADASLERQVERVSTLLRDQYRISAPLSTTDPATLSVRAAGITSSIQVPAVTGAPAVTDPYRRTGPPPWLTPLLLTIAAELAVLGLLVAVRPRRRRRVAARPPSPVDAPTVPPEQDEAVLRAGAGARTSS